MFLCRFLCPILMWSYGRLSSIELTYLSSASIDGLWTMSKHCAPSSLICSSTFCYPSSTSIDLRSVWESVCLRKHPHRHMTSFPSSLCTEIQASTNLASHPNPIPFPWILPLSSCLLWLLIYLLLHIFLLCRQIAHAHRILLLLTTFSDLHYSMPVKLSHVIYFRKKKFQRHSLLHHERSKAPCLNPPASLSERINWNPVLHTPSPTQLCCSRCHYLGSGPNYFSATPLNSHSWLIPCQFPSALHTRYSRLIPKSKFDQLIPLLAELNWLPISLRGGKKQHAPIWHPRYFRIWPCIPLHLHSTTQPHPCFTGSNSRMTTLHPCQCN